MAKPKKKSGRKSVPSIGEMIRQKAAYVVLNGPIYNQIGKALKDAKNFLKENVEPGEIIESGNGSVKVVEKRRKSFDVDVFCALLKTRGVKASVIEACRQEAQTETTYLAVV